MEQRTAAGTRFSHPKLGGNRAGLCRRWRHGMSRPFPAPRTYNAFMEATRDIEARLRDYFSAHGEAEGLAAAYLFGSRARGTARPESDVDVGVLYADDPPPDLAGLGGHLEAALERLLRLPVQIVVLNRAPVDLAKRVLRDGILLLDRDPSRRIRFEVRTRQEFWDLEPFLRRYRRYSEETRR
jgi:predicted nucleotidyltransferase